MDQDNWTYSPGQPHVGPCSSFIQSLHNCCCIYNYISSILNIHCVMVAEIIFVLCQASQLYIHHLWSSGRRSTTSVCCTSWLVLMSNYHHTFWWHILMLFQLMMKQSGIFLHFPLKFTKASCMVVDPLMISIIFLYVIAAVVCFKFHFQKVVKLLLFTRNSSYCCSAS